MLNYLHFQRKIIILLEYWRGTITFVLEFKPIPMKVR